MTDGRSLVVRPAIPARLGAAHKQPNKIKPKNSHFHMRTKRGRQPLHKEGKVPTTSWAIHSTLDWAPPSKVHAMYGSFLARGLFVRTSYLLYLACKCKWMFEYKINMNSAACLCFHQSERLSNGSWMCLIEVRVHVTVHISSVQEESECPLIQNRHNLIP